MITAASLKDYTLKDLAQMAKKKGVSGWHSMRKDQLVRALVRAAKDPPPRKNGSSSKTVVSGSSSNGNSSPSRLNNGNRLGNGSDHRHVPTTKPATTNGKASPLNGKKPVGKVDPPRDPPAKSKSPLVSRRIKKANAQRQQLKDLAFSSDRDEKSPRTRVIKDRAVLMVRDAYWLHVHWELSRRSVQRASVAMAEHWHTAKPTLRLFEVDHGSTTSSVEQVARDIEIHGGVTNWYIDVQDPPRSYRVALGYLAASGKFYTLARSNVVSTPSPGSCDAIDENWTDVEENYERIYALSGGYCEDGSSGDLQELFEERLRRPMGSPSANRYGVGAEGFLGREREFLFEVEAEMIIYGRTKPNAHLTLSGEPLKLRPDGSFSVRLTMPDRRQVLPVVASSSDGVEQRTVVLAIERNTKVMEPRIRDAGD